MKKYLLAALFALPFGYFSMPGAHAQTAPVPEWDLSLGGLLEDEGAAVAVCSDGGYVVLCEITSTNGMAAGNHGGYDLLVVRVDAAGAVVWSRCLGGSGNEHPGDIQQTTDGGFIVGADTDSNNGDVSGNHGEADVWLVKLDGGGQVQWQRCLGGSDTDGSVDAIRQLPDGGFYLAASSHSNDGDAIGNHGSADYWVLRLDAAGAPVWSRQLGGYGYESASDLSVTADGGCIVLGIAGIADGDVTFIHGMDDIWVMKLDAAGNVEWQRSYGGSDEEYGWSITVDPSGGYIMAGSTGSSDGDVSANHGIWDYWLVNIAVDGEIIWETSLGGSMLDIPSCIEPTSDGGFMAIGYTSSTDGQITNYLGGSGDVWLVKVDSVGQLLWQTTYGGSGWDGGGELEKTSDGGFICVGSSDSGDGDVSVQLGDYDAWLLKLGPDYTGVGEVGPINELSLFPNPAVDQVTLRYTLLQAGPVHYTLLNSQGQQLQHFTDGNAAPGMHAWHFDASHLAPGVYLLRVVSSGQTVTQRLVRR